MRSLTTPPPRVVINSSRISYNLLFAIYLGFGSIYWLPGLEVRILVIAKIIVFVLLSMPVLIHLCNGSLRFPSSYRYLLLFLLLILFSIPGFFRGDANDSIYYVANIIQILVFIVICEYSYCNGFLMSIITNGVKIFCGVAIISLYFMIRFPEIVSPLNDLLFIRTTGFGGSRTSWSPAISLFLPWVLVWWLASRKSLRFLFYSLLILMLIANQVLTQGRSGLLGDAAALAGMILFVPNRKTKYIALGLVAVGAYLILADGSYVRLGANIQDISNGRFAQYLAVPGLVADAPLLGHGIGTVLIDGNWVHNTVLRHAVEVGVPAALVMIIIITRPVLIGMRKLRRHTGNIRAPFLTLLAGLAISLVEPSAIFGNFNLWAIWWACWVLCIHKDETQSMCTRIDRPTGRATNQLIRLK